MKKIKLLQLTKTVAKIDDKLIDIERLLIDKFNEPNLEFKKTSAFETLYYFNIALRFFASVIDFIVKLVEAYTKIP